MPIQTNTNKKEIKKRTAAGLLSVCAIAMVYVFSVNFHVLHTSKPYILTAEEAKKLNADCILVLGCGLRKDGSPSDMLRDRLDRAIELYKSAASPKLLMSGDHGRKDYNEVGAMKRYAMEAGIPSKDIFMDHAGFSTYESVYRAKKIFCAEKIIIVTQKYHLSRALYIAKALGLEAYGVPSDLREYVGTVVRNLREIMARNKDFLTSAFKPEPKYGGEAIPVSGNAADEEE